MFQIRQDQYDSMSTRAMYDFEQRAIAYLYESHPECVVEAGDEAFTVQVKSSIQTAMKNGIDLEIYVVQFVELDLESSPRLDSEFQSKWNEILTDQALDQVQKVDRLKSLVYGMPDPPQSESDEEE